MTRPIADSIPAPSGVAAITQRLRNPSGSASATCPEMTQGQIAALSGTCATSNRTDRAE